MPVPMAERMKNVFSKYFSTLVGSLLLIENSNDPGEMWEHKKEYLVVEEHKVILNNIHQ